MDDIPSNKSQPKEDLSICLVSQAQCTSQSQSPLDAIYEINQ